MLSSRRILPVVLSALLPLSGQAGSPDEGDGHDRMLRILGRFADERENLPFIGSRRMRDLEAFFQSGATVSAQDAFDRALSLGNEQNAQGFPEKAITSYTYAREVLRRFRQDPAREALVSVKLGEVWLRRAETENCCSRHTPESCILPLRGGAIHTRREFSEQAILHLRDAVSYNRGDGVHYHAVWLLNLAYMTLGEYPDKVPETYRLPPSLFAREFAFPRFPNRSEELGLARDSLAGGAVADDFDGDGDVDLVLSSWDPAVSLTYYENRGDEGFHERSAEAGFTGLGGGLNIVQADYDNDGDIDLYVQRGGWMGVLGRQPDSLLRNDGSGTFRDVTFAAGLGDPAYPCQVAAWADYDLDGHLDLFVGNERSEVDSPCQIFRNRGDGTFEERGSALGLMKEGIVKGATWTDVNNDRYPDLYVSNLNGPNSLYLNRSGRRFENTAIETALEHPRRSFPVWSWDVNNDGNRDLFVHAYTNSTSEAAHQALLGIAPPADYTAKLFLGKGDGTFTIAPAGHGLDRLTLTMGCAVGDLNNDGWEDAYLGTGDPNLSTLLPNRLFINDEGRGFQEATMASGLGHLQKGHGTVFADFDRDGDLDIFLQLGGAVPVDRYRDAYFENPGFPGAWIQVRAIGTRSNRSGIGTRIRVTVRTESGQVRTIHREVSSGGSFGSSPLTQHIGLGNATAIEKLELHWPASDERQIFEDITPRRLIVVTEGNPTPRQEARPAFSW